MKYNEIKNLTIADLRKRLEETKHQLFENKMKLSMKQLPNPLVIRFLRKDQARLMTALKEKGMKANKKGTANE